MMLCPHQPLHPSPSILSVLVIFVVTRVKGNTPPKFLLDDGESEIVLILKEGSETPVGSLIYRLRGFDGDGDKLTFGIKGQLGSEVLKIQTTTDNEASVFLNRELDRETQDEYDFVLTLTDGKLGSNNYITQSMLLLIEDVNDNEPIFKPYNSTIFVRENGSPGLLTVLEAKDIDEGPFGQVLYQLDTPAEDAEVFSMATADGRGVLRVTKSLDYEQKSFYHLKVLAIDRAVTGRLTSTADILIKVIDVEDQSPEFVTVPPITRIAEDIQIESSVLQVRAIDGDRGVNNPIKYRISAGPTDLFRMDENTGTIYTRMGLDRERLDTSNGAYILEIQAQEQSKIVFPPPKVTTEVTIILTDINDETPTFRSSQYVAEIDENSPVNVPVTFVGSDIPECFDSDQGNNGSFALYLEDDDGIFEVTPAEGINDVSFSVRVKKPERLDFEEVKVITFRIIAKELVSENPKSSSAEMVVHIRDVNDNSPEFMRSSYQVSVPENVKPGTTIAWTQARDPDSGMFGTQGIKYTSIRGSISHLLSLDPDQGIITVKNNNGTLDRESIANYFLIVEAKDSLGTGNRNTAQLEIKLVDINDNAPYFMQPVYEASIRENSVEFLRPLIVEAFDKDEQGTPNSKIRYAIIEGDYGGNFTIDDTTGEIRPKTTLDYEAMVNTGEQRYFNLTVAAFDLGIPEMMSSISVIVYVTDENDHTPQFNRIYYSITIPEDVPPGSSVLRVLATDDDGSSSFNRVVYRLQRGAVDKFVLDSTLGVISVAEGASLDPDLSSPRKLYYVLEVVALDSGVGSQQRTSSTTVNITIADVNNKPPLLIDPGKVLLRENSNVGKFIKQMRADDPDNTSVLRFWIDPNECEARNEEGSLVIISEYNYTEAFELDEKSGVMRVAKSLDREKVEIVKLTIKVEDMEAQFGQQSATGTLTVTIEDQNDNDPVFRKPLYRRSVPENSPNGARMLGVVADDPDKNRTIKYSLEGAGQVLSLLHLDPLTGEIVVKQRIDREAFSWLNFTILATDSGVPTRSSRSDVIIQILDENDNNPVFIKQYGNITVRENTPVGSVITRIEARDADAGDNGRITYLLDRRSSYGKFQINPDTGDLTVVDNLDRESKAYYSLLIEAWDNYQFGYATGESRNTFQQIGVYIGDENDEIPEFAAHQDCTVITEFHQKGDIITLVSAADKDDPSSSNSHIEFTIKQGNEEGLFSLIRKDDLSAGLFSRQNLQTKFGNYSLLIEAKDKGEPPNVVESVYSVCVIDYNDHAPRFIHPPQNFSIKVPENATVGTKVIQVIAVDEDIGINAAIRYKIREDTFGHWQTFIIEEETGWVILNQELDRERQKVYDLRVEAIDRGIPTTLSSDLDLTIYVRDINDYAPQFLQDEFQVNFTEHNPPGQERYKIIDAVDRDELDEDAKKIPVCYFIVAGNEGGFFTIDQYTHTLLAMKELDREEKAVHVLVVKATEDCYNVPEKIDFFDSDDDTLLKINIFVNDINDNYPKFVKRVFTGGITTDADYGQEILTIEAIDLDDGPNSELRYYLQGKTRSTLSEGFGSTKKEPFIVEAKTGKVVLNFDPLKGMKGYFDFEVSVNDTDGFGDVARVFIYLLREDQRIRFVLRSNPAEIRQKSEEFRRILGNVTKSVVNIDEYKIHENRDGSVDRTKTDLYVHFVNKSDHSIMDVKTMLLVIDKHIEKLDQLFKDLNVLDSQPAELQAEKSEREEIAILSLVGVTIFLASLWIVTLSLCLTQRSKYIRKLKAATATAFGSHSTDLDNSGRVPNTNIHSVEGSNPIWLRSYEEWFKEVDNTSQTNEGDSLDSNAIIRDDAGKQIHKNSNYSTLTVRDTCNQSNLPSNMVRMSQHISKSNSLIGGFTVSSSDLDRTLRHNLYNIDRHKNPLLVEKPVEITEL